jgi:HlyD family secretion protein
VLKWILLLVVVFALAIGAGVFAFTQAGGEEGTSFNFSFGRGSGDAAGTPVRVEPAATGDLIRTVSAPGSIEPQTLVQISSQVSAKVLAVPFREGEMVGKDEVILRLDPQNLVAQLDSAKASLRSEEARLDGAKADLINARLAYERLQQLVETGDAPQSELDAAEATYLRARSQQKVIEASIQIAQANIDRVEKDLENTVISSPIDGTVIAMNTEVGETVIVGTTNTPGSVVMEIGDLASMIVKAQVDETNIAPVEVGQAATVFINAYDDEEFRGRVVKIGRKRQVSSSGTGYFVVEIALELEEGRTLLSGLTASVDIEVEPFFDVVKVPSQAVLDRRVEDLPTDFRDHPLIDREKTFTTVVYRMVDGKSVVTPVRVGPSDLTDTVIEEGLEAGAVIVVGPYRELEGLKHDQAIRDETIDLSDAGDTEADEPTPDDPGESEDDGQADEAGTVAASEEEPAPSDG